MTGLHPLSLRLTGRRCVVVGGGPVAARRVAGLLEAGGQVIVVAPAACADLAAAASRGSVEWVPREYRHGDLAGAWLAHAATGAPEVDAAVAAEAEEARVWCVVASDATLATAWVPATAHAEGVTVAVNADRDPGLAVRVRDRVAAQLAAGELPTRRSAARRADEGRSGAGRAGESRPGEGRSGEGPEARQAHGSVALVGGGPGSSGLVTARGRALLARADVVVVDRLAPHGVLDELDEDVLVIDVGKTPSHHPVPQPEINATLIEHALAGRRVVRLKGGDPYVFGRGGEELEACAAAGIPVEVVPGVTSAIAVPAAAGIPVTHRGVSRGFTVLTGHEDVGAVPPAADHTVILLMGVSLLGRTCAGLVAAGRDAATPVAVVEDGYGPRQRVTVGTLETIAAEAERVGVRPPAVTVVGDVVRLSPAWAEREGRR